VHVTSLTIRCHRSQRRLTDDDSLSLAKVTCVVSLTIGQESFSVSGHRCVHGMGACLRHGAACAVPDWKHPREASYRAAPWRPINVLSHEFLRLKAGIDI